MKTLKIEWTKISHIQMDIELNLIFIRSEIRTIEYQESKRIELIKKISGLKNLKKKYNYDKERLAEIEMKLYNLECKLEDNNDLDEKKQMCYYLKKQFTRMLEEFKQEFGDKNVYGIISNS